MKENTVLNFRFLTYLAWFGFMFFMIAGGIQAEETIRNIEKIIAYLGGRQ